jgi:hypothetical protein
LKQRNSNIAPLAFLLLILFVSPITIKAIHHHLPIQKTSPADARGCSISATTGTCAVCQFEFVPFLAFDNLFYDQASLLASLNKYEPTNGLKSSFYGSYFLRAPPVF